MDVKVNEFRNKIEHLFRKFNADYHACVDDKERNYWASCTKRVYFQLKDMTCKRATPEDKENLEKVLFITEQYFGDDLKLLDIEHFPLNQMNVNYSLRWRADT